MMYSTKDDLKCKYCGFVKSKLDLYCYFHWNGGIWSDLRHIAPDVTVPGIVQYCPECGRYYNINAEGVIINNTQDFNWIEPVTYEDIKPSFCEYENYDWTIEGEFTQRLRLLWAYNDKFYRSKPSPAPSEEDLLVNRQNLKRIASMYDDCAVKAEYLREAGLFDECLDLCTSIEAEDESEKFVLKQIEIRAKAGNSEPFLIEFE